jgi:CheY-like chemotaxis protein/HPt (histidine-containing phosphotransfer) domain-containing protein
VVGDRGRLRQVLVNLVGNAVKFTERGEVRIRLRVEPADNARVCVRLAVIDTGIGIAPEAHGRIFERFMQADRAVAHQFGGTGLGLNISRSLIELMGGRLSLQSELGVGSTFEAEVTLPLAPTQPAPDITEESLAGLDVLVVRRNASKREVNEGLLRFAGASFRGVGTAAEAQAEIARRVPHVMVVGEVLPDSTGVDLAKKIWNDRYGQTPVIKVVQVSSLRAMAAKNVGNYGIAACVYTPAKQVRLVRAIRVAAGLEPKLDERRADRAGRPQTGPKRPRILLVEDNRDAWLRASLILGARYEVNRAENGLDAVASVAAVEYDLVLMDVALPQIDGIEATKRIRAREADTARHVPIVALTAHAVESVRQEALAAGMDDYATKPISKQQLLDICAKWVDRRPLLLIADDSPDNQLLLATYLRGSDYRLSFVATGKEVVDAVASRLPSLILLDMNMPVMDGYEAARTIRSLPGGESVPILALTAHDGPQERERCLAAGCTDFLSKPVHRNDVLERVAALLGDRDAPASAEPTDSETTLPSADGVSFRLHRQLALRDFEGAAALAVSIGSAARMQQLSEVAAVCEELADSARSRDAERSAWWSQQLIARLRLAWAPPARQTGPSGSAGDALSRLALLTLGVPTAGLTRNSHDRVLIVGAAGVPTGLDVSNGFPLANSLSRVIVETKRPLVVEDVRNDPRLNRALIVSNHSVAAVAAWPLTDKRGTVIGAFWALDDRPRSWPPREIAMLENIAALATQLIDSERSSEPAAVDAEGAVVVDDDIVPLMPDYVAGLRQDVAAMREDVEGGDMDKIAARGHKMKGSGAGYGLPRVSELGREIEDAARGGDTNAIRALIHDLDGHLTGLKIRSADGRVSMEL